METYKTLSDILENAHQSFRIYIKAGKTFSNKIADQTLLIDMLSYQLSNSDWF